MPHSITTAIRNTTAKPALMTHVVAGFPSLDDSKQIVRMMGEVGADLIEIQIPFSDPVADGPTMQRCNELALANGFRVREAFVMAEELQKEVSAPLLFMTYFNIIHQYGVQAFCERAARSGVGGLIVPDMPIDEEPAEHLIESCRAHGLAWIPVVSPLTTAERIKALAAHATGFWYLVSRSGVTGVEQGFAPETDRQIAGIRQYSDLPIALAFGVSTPEHVAAIVQKADLAVVGSLVQNFFLREGRSFGENLSEARDCLLHLRPISV
jgi:tryptophan synthase alpha subunit